MIVEGLDLDRLPWEIRKALDAEMVVAEGFDVGALVIRVADGNVFVMDGRGGDVCGDFAAYRLGDVSEDLIAERLDETLRAMWDNGDCSLVTKPWSDWVTVRSNTAEYVQHMHRRVVVPDWIGHLDAEAG